jgi:hypothetical protein
MKNPNPMNAKQLLSADFELMEDSLVGISGDALRFQNAEGFLNATAADVERHKTRIHELNNGWGTSTWLERGLLVNKHGLDDWRAAYICRVQQGKTRSKCVGIKHRDASRDVIRRWYSTYGSNVRTLEAMIRGEQAKLDAASKALEAAEKAKQEVEKTKQEQKKTETKQQELGQAKGKRTLTRIGIGVAILAVLGAGAYYGLKYLKK